MKIKRRGLRMRRSNNNSEIRMADAGNEESAEAGNKELTTTELENNKNNTVMPLLRKTSVIQRIRDF